jgi:hypothetical protein
MPNEGEEVQPKFHVWNFRLTRTSIPQQFEFGNALTKREAGDRIAKQLGMKELPYGAVLSQRELERLEPLEAQPEQETEPEEKPQTRTAEKPNERDGKGRAR